MIKLDKPIITELKKLNDLLRAYGLVLSVVLSLLLLSLSIVLAPLYDIKPLHFLERIKAEQKSYDDAEKQRQFQRKVVENHLSLAEKYLDDRLYFEASQEFDKALVIDKLNEKAQIGHFIVEAAHRIQNDFRPQAIERQLHFLQQQQPDNPYVQVLFGDLLVQQGELMKAKKRYQAAINTNHQPASAYFGLGSVYEMQNRMADARKYYQKAVEHSPWNSAYVNNLATVHRKLGHYGKSIKLFEKILHMDRDYLLAHLGISKSYALAGKLVTAMRYQQRLEHLLDQPDITALSKNAPAWFFHGELFETADQKRQYILYNMGLSLFLLGKEEEAQQVLQQAQQITTGIEARIRKAVEQNLELLLEKQAQYRSWGEHFRQQYLSPKFRSSLS